MNEKNETIVAPATPWGYSAISIIRVSGDRAHQYTSRLFAPFSRDSGDFSPEPYRMYRGHLVAPDSRDPYDDIMICFMKGPRSYTGEDMVEIYCHGSPVIMQLTLKYYQESGARMAEPGEFTRRAFFNGKMDLLQAESVNQIIHSRTRQGEKAAYKILQGRLSCLVDNMKKDVIHLLSQIHAHIDFPLEVEEIPENEYKRTCQNIMEKVNRLLSSYEYGSRLQSGLNVVIAGAPNVGKSSLFNALLVEDRALVTSVPGTTRDALREIINVKGIPITLVDTAGFRQTRHKVEKMGIDLTRKALAEADLVIMMLDGSRRVNEQDKNIWQLIQDKEYITVLNKSDMLNETRKKYYENECPGTVPVSSLRGDGLDVLNEKIYKKAVRVQPRSSELAITSLRHKMELERAQKAMKECMSVLEKGYSEEVLLVDLEEALNALQCITGEIATDDILDKIFDQFCLGK